MERRLVTVGMFKDPEDIQKPYYVSIAWFENSPDSTAVVQPVSEEVFFFLLGSIFGKYGPIMLDVELEG